MLDAPNMLLIGAAGRDAGKTVFACELINRYRNAPVRAAKVTVIQERNGQCPRGGEGCGVCSSLEGDYRITEETQSEGLKDTQRLLAAGAQRVFWLCVMKEHLEEGARALLDLLGPNMPIICESNSLRHAVAPGLFLLVKQTNSETVKVSARTVQAYADAILPSERGQVDFDIEKITYENNRWRLQ